MKPKILVAGHINLENTLRVEGFPLEYNPVNYPFFGVNSTVAGVGLNITLALQTLGADATLFTLTGRDAIGELIEIELGRWGMNTDYVLPQMRETCQSVIIYDSEGRRQIHTDLKDIQNQNYPLELYKPHLVASDLAVICNINFARPFLKTALQAGKMIATDVHAISDLEDDYNRDFMSYAHILFMSHENLPTDPATWAQEVAKRYGTNIIVIGMGSGGALLHVPDDDLLLRLPAVTFRPIVNTIGAGDALFSAFLFSYLQKPNPRRALEKAIRFAGYKIGETGAAQGFLTAEELDDLE